MNFLPSAKHEYEFQMVSFVDVVFVLLSFFVLGSSFRMPERDFGLGYAEAQKAQLSPGAKAGDFPENVQVELRLKDTGVGITVGRARLADNNFDAIRAKLTEINMPSLGVLVLAEPSLSVDQVAKAMDAVLASPMKKISVAALPKPPSAKTGPEGIDRVAPIRLAAADGQEVRP